LALSFVFFIFVLIFSVFFLASYFHSRSRPWAKPPTFHEKMEMAKMAKPLTPQEIYEKMLDTYILGYGTILGKRYLEKKIDKYIKQGSIREEAILKVAKDEEYK